jgi:lupus La protein
MECDIDDITYYSQYYFGDANLPHDKFIKLESARSEGWFPVDLLLKFNKVNSILDK